MKKATNYYFDSLANSISMKASFSYFENTGNRSLMSNRNYNTAVAASLLLNGRINDEEFANLILDYKGYLSIITETMLRM